MTLLSCASSSELVPVLVLVRWTCAWWVSLPATHHRLYVLYWKWASVQLLLSWAILLSEVLVPALEMKEGGMRGCSPGSPNIYVRPTQQCMMSITPQRTTSSLMIVLLLVFHFSSVFRKLFGSFNACSVASLTCLTVNLLRSDRKIDAATLRSRFSMRASLGIVSRVSLASESEEAIVMFC